MTHLTADDTPNSGEPGASPASDSLLSLLTALREQLLARCNTEEELKTLCADLGVNYDDLPAQGREAKAREFVARLYRHKRIADLQAMLARPRPIITPAIDDYLTALRDYCANLPYLTLHDIRPPKTLDEVYVPLKARPQPRKDEKPERNDERAMRELERNERLSISDVMRKHDPPHILILGEPGAGKSTLLRQLAEHAWDAPDKIGLDAPYLPILMPLRRLASADGGKLEGDPIHLLSVELTSTYGLPPRFFTDWPKQTGANWLILLDALDEVPAEQRPQLMQWLRGLLRRIGLSRIVLTSRPPGYTRGELDDKLFSHYELLSFTPDQTSEFARKWFGDKAEPFLKELDRVRAGALSGTPLLLTIAAKVYLEKGTLPERRSGLYGQFVDIWLDEAEKQGLRNELNERVRNVMKYGLAKLALAMTEQAHWQWQKNLGKIAASYLRDALHLSNDEAETIGHTFVEVMARRSGMFFRNGDEYGFIHFTFREYLASVSLVRECNYDPEQVWARVVSWWNHPVWRDMVLFALEILIEEKCDATSLICHIRHSSMEGLFLASAVLARGANCDQGIHHQIIDELLARLRCDSMVEYKSILALGELRGSQRAADGLLVLARDDQREDWARRLAAEGLSKLGRTEEAVSILLALGYDQKVDPRGRVQVAESLSELGRTAEAVTVLERAAYDEQVDASTRVEAAEVLGELGRANEAVSILLTLANDKKTDPWARLQAAEVLSKLERIEEAAAVLLNLTNSTKVEASKRVEGAVALGKLGWTDEAVSVLLELAHGKRISWQVRVAVAEALVELGWINEAVNIELRLLRDKRVNSQVRDYTLGVLNQQTLQTENIEPIFLALAHEEGIDDEIRQFTAIVLLELERFKEAVPILLALARDGSVDKEKRTYAAAMLGMMARFEESARVEKFVPTLLTLAHDVQLEARSRAACAMALGGLGWTAEAVRILKGLVGTETVQASMRVTVAEGLAELGQTDEAVSILSTLAYDKKTDWEAHVHAAVALGKLGESKKATPILLALARDNKADRDMLVHAAKTLDEMKKVGEFASVLLTLAQDLETNWDVRLDAVETLGKLGRADDLLALALDEHLDDQMRIEAAEALEKLGQAEKLVPVLLLITHHEQSDWYVRARAVRMLDKLGQADDLLILAYDESASWRVRKEAIRALGRLGRANDLLTLANDGRTSILVRREAVLMLGELGITECIPALLALARDEKTTQYLGFPDSLVGWRVDEFFVSARLDSLGRSRQDSERAQYDFDTPLVEILGRLRRADDLLVLASDCRINGHTRVQAAITLGKLEHTSQAVTILLELAHDRRVMVYAAEGLSKLGRVDEARSILSVLVRDEKVEARVRGEAAETLGKFADARVLPDLEHIARKDSDKDVRLAVQWAIKQIRKRTGTQP